MVAHPARTATSARRCGAVDEVPEMLDDAVSSAISRRIFSSARRANIISACTRSTASRCSSMATSSRSAARSCRAIRCGWTDKTSYPQKLERDREKSKLTEGVVCGFASIGTIPVALGVMDFNFRGGTMGTVVGERLARLFEGAREKKLPVVVCTASGGARMEEGMLALMQMAKTTVALQRFRDDGGYAITVLTDPTTGGVSASFAFQTDVIVAEARASIGFAGRRVIEQTIRQKLPDNFQTAEFLLEHGAIDMVVERGGLRALLDASARLRRRRSPARPRAARTDARPRERRRERDRRARKRAARTRRAHRRSQGARRRSAGRSQRRDPRARSKSTRRSSARSSVTSRRGSA